jgi:hypothetical protein
MSPLINGDFSHHQFTAAGGDDVSFVSIADQGMSYDLQPSDECGHSRISQSLSLLSSPFHIQAPYDGMNLAVADKM